VGVGLTTWLTAMLAGRSTLGWYDSRGSFGEREVDPDFRFMPLFSISCNVRAYLLPGTVSRCISWNRKLFGTKFSLSDMSEASVSTCSLISVTSISLGLEEMSAAVTVKGQPSQVLTITARGGEGKKQQMWRWHEYSGRL
jgi:hypothetical protein